MAGRGDLIGLLEVDPELGRGIAAEDLEDARRLVVGRRVVVMPGPWDPTAISDDDNSPFAALVIDGLMTRERALGGTVHAEILGPGDVLSRGADQSLVPFNTRWSCAIPTTIALLDRRFLAAVRRWPMLSMRLYERVAEQRERASLLAAINSIRNVEQRILAVLWHLAGLYGTVETDGDVVLPMRLSHEAIGHLVGARRPTVTLAMKVLSESSLVEQDRDTGFIIREHSRTTLAPEEGSFAGSRMSGIVGLEPLERNEPLILGGDSAEARALGRLREQVFVLRESETGLRAMFDLAGIGVALLDGRSGELLDLNQRLATMLGSEKRALLGESLWSHVKSTHGESLEQRIAPLIAHRARETGVDLTASGDAGSPRWLRADFTTLDDVEERSRIIGVFQDTTIIKRAEIEARREAERDAFRVALNDALLRMDDPVAMQIAAAELLGSYLSTDNAYAADVETDPDEIVLRVHRDNPRNGVPSVEGLHKGTSYNLPDLLRKQTFAVSDSIAKLAKTDAERAAWKAVGVRAFVSVPLYSEGEWVAIICVTQSVPRAWTEEEVSLVEETAERMREAVVGERAARALEASEERFRGLLETVDQGFCILERIEPLDGGEVDYRFITTNSAFYSHTTLPDVTGKTVLESIPGLDRAILEAYDEVLRSGERAYWENYVESLDIWTATHSVPMSEPNRVAVLFSNITERKQVEETRFQTLLEATGAVIWETDADGLVVKDSPTWREYTGQTLEEWTGWGWTAVIHPDDREMVTEDWRRTAEEQTQFDLQFRLWHAASKEYRRTWCRAVPNRDGDGTIVGFVGMNLELD